MASPFAAPGVSALAALALVVVPSHAMALQDFGKGRDEVLPAYRFEIADTATAAKCAAGGGKVVTGRDVQTQKESKFCIGGSSTPPNGGPAGYETVPFSEAPYAFSVAYDSTCWARGGLVAYDANGRSDCLRPKKTAPKPAPPAPSHSH